MNMNDLEKTSKFKLGEGNKAFDKYFMGKSYLSVLNNQEVNICNVTFEPGCRNNWHVHHGCGQILICVGGEGWYQEEGSVSEKLIEGDIKYIPPEVKHWHGATKDKAFSHLALSVIGENHSNEWLEEVSEKEYNKL